MTDTPSTIRAIRAKLSMTQEQLAERLGVSFATVNRWEGGTTTPQKAAQGAIDALLQEAGLENAVDSAVPAASVTRRGVRSRSGSS